MLTSEQQGVHQLWRTTAIHRRAVQEFDAAEDRLRLPMHQEMKMELDIAYLQCFIRVRKTSNLEESKITLNALDSGIIQRHLASKS